MRLGAIADEDGVYLDAESRAGVEPIDQLLANRHELVEKLAQYWALYGPGGTAEHGLSAERARIVGLLRAIAASKHERMTEAALESGSRAHPDYLGLLAKQTTERAQYFKLQERIRGIDFKIQRGQAVMRLFASEART